MRTIETHSETVMAIRWLPDDSGFMSAGLDQRILIWVGIHLFICKVTKLTNRVQDAEGNQRDSWGMATIRVTDLDVSPNMTKVVAVGIIHLPPTPHPPSSTGASPAPGARGDSTSQSPQAQPQAYPPKPENRMIVYDMITKQTVACVSLELFSDCNI